MAALTPTVDVVQDVPVADPGTADDLAALVRFVLAEEERDGGWDISVALISDDALRRLHRDFLGLDTVTDIMTFPRGDGELGGDIAISVDRAEEQGAALGHSTWDEVRFLAVHGVLHLCGWDDAEAAAMVRMLARQDEILAAWASRPPHAGAELPG